MPPIPKVSVIIISYNSEDFIGECISSVMKNLPRDGEIVVLDNCSTDQTVKELRKFLPKVKLIKSSLNLGFAKGNNKAAKETQGEYLFFLNPDTQIEKPIFDELTSYYKNTSDAGIVAPRLIMPDGKVQPSVKKLPTIWGAVKEYIFGIKNAYSQYVPEDDKPIAVEMVYGAAMLIKRDLFEKLAGFDEKFFLYYEDADLCRRVREFGKKTYYYPGVSIKHLVGGTVSERDKYQFNLESAKKYHGYLKALIFQLIFLVPRLRRHF